MGRLELHSFKSAVLERNRQLRIYLPDDYDAAREEFPVLWQHDGQMAFTERDEILPFGSWGIDEWIERLSGEGNFRTPIVVAIDNSPKRQKEYDPQTPEYQKYREFLCNELIPWVRERFRVTPLREDNALMGSSMGGLVSFALCTDEPETFGAAACLSPWFEVNGGAYVREVLRPMQQKPNVRLYFDSGIHDWRGLDDSHRAMLKARNELVRLGYVVGEDLDVFVDTWFPTEADFEGTPVKKEKYAEQKINQHTEFFWRRRLARPLKFLFGNRGT